MTRAVISAYLRTPFTPAKKGDLARTRPDQMLGDLLRDLLAKANIDNNLLEDVIIGCAFPEGEQGFNIARISSFIAGLPEKVAGQTINRFCGSSMQAIHSAAAAIMSGIGEAYICGGVESMTRIPMGGFNPLPHPDLYKNMPQVYMSMGMTAENLAKKYNISRIAQEEFALHSHEKAAKANLAREINKGKDGCIRADSSLAAMATLEPAFLKGGSVTAATASPITDGAAALLVVSEDFAKKNGLPILAVIKSMAVSGCEPEIMGIGAAVAANKVLQRAGLKFSDMGLAEMNEAFAAQVLACYAEMGIDGKNINLEGGAIAIGHPLGASGARICGKAALLLSESEHKYALASMCIGGGQGIATILERV